MSGSIVSKFNDSNGGCLVGGFVGSLLFNAYASLINISFSGDAFSN